MAGINKVSSSHIQAMPELFDGMTIMSGGFGLCGIPEGLIDCIAASGVKDLTIISNNAGIAGFGLGVLLENKQVSKVIASYVGENAVFEAQLMNGDIEVELVPQGSLAERIRAGGSGIPAFYTPAGYGTVVANGKECRSFNGKMHILEHALVADLSIIKAWKGDRYGNLLYRKTARNFNPVIAAAGKKTIAEVEEIVEPDELAPNIIHTPGIYVDQVVKGSFEKRIERIVTAG